MSSWARADAVEDGHSARGGIRLGRSATSPSPPLHAVHEKVGWVGSGALNYIARRLTIPPADVYGVATF